MGKYKDNMTYEINGDVVIVRASQGGEVKREFLFKISFLDLDRVLQYRWYQEPIGYIKTSLLINNKRIRLHNFIMGESPRGTVIDHKDRDRTNNTRANLRFVSPSLNNFNSEKRSNITGSTGITYNKRRCKKPWHARIGGGTTRHIGYFKTKEEAVQARKRMELLLFGELKQ